VIAAAIIAEEEEEEEASIQATEDQNTMEDIVAIDNSFVHLSFTVNTVLFLSFLRNYSV